MSRFSQGSQRAAVLLSIGSSLLHAGVAAAQPEPTKLLMHYMPWYQTPDVTGFWGIHWTGPNNEFNPDTLAADGRPAIYSHYDPLIGPYDSKDPAVLECHLLQMKLAGIDGVLVDWYGLSDTFDYPLIHDATEALFAATEQFGLEFAVVYEDRSIESQVNLGTLDPSAVGAYLLGEFAWMQASWFNRPHYTRKDGRPLLLNFGPIFVQNAADWNTGFSVLPLRPWFYALPNLWTTAGADGAFTWVPFPVYEGNPSEAVIKQRLIDTHNTPSTDPDRVIPSAVAGFKDIYEPGGRFPFLDHRNGATLREGLEVGIDGPWDIVQLVTWNDYGEGTMIEPTFEFGYTFLEVIQTERREEIGPSFPFDAGDLRLPARLLEARRGVIAPASILDAVSNSLSAGQTDAAATMLSLLEGTLQIDAPEAPLVRAGEPLAIALDLPGNGDGVQLQWFRDGQPVADNGRITGAQTPVLHLAPATVADAGIYAVRVSLGAQEAVSPETVVGVLPSPLGPADADGNGALSPGDIDAFLRHFIDAGGG
ncbi:MAG: hypothetical protein ACTS22_03920 [Phycisphaerales bacterium]